MSMEAQARATLADLAPVLGLLRSIAGGVDVVSAERAGTASRNRLVRIRLSPAIPAESLIVKEASRATDAFFAHHLRREERLLDLLARFAPDLAPRCYGLILAPDERGWLVLEDVGAESLADRLADLGPGRAVAELEATLARVRNLHRALREHRAPFYRTCYAVDLDRFGAATIRSRFEVAWRRLAGIAGAAPDPPRATLRAWSSVMEPLLAAPRQMIHNSLSPLNVVLGPDARPRIVDFETMALGPACVDVGELLRQPFAPIDWETTARLAGVGGDDRVALRLASLARSLDYAGSNARQSQQADGNPSADGGRLRQRLRWYCREARDLIAGVGDLRPLDDLLAAVDTATRATS